jgi:ABC-type transport system substrate-binding protein
MTKSKKVLLMLSLVFVLTLAMLPLNIAKAQDEYLFEVTLIAPGNANMMRRQWGQIIANSWRQLGIDARVVYLGWASVYDRVFTPDPAFVGKTYDEGGFDVQLVGWTPGLLPEPRQLYYGGDPNFLAPTGQNYPLWNNSEANLLMDTFITSTDPDEQNQTLQAYQTIFFNDPPASQIYYESRPFVVSPDLGGPALVNPITGAGGGWLYANAQVDPEWLTGRTEVVYASTGEIESLIPPLSNSWYDTIINGIIFNGLVEIAPDLSDLSIPALLTDWTPSENGFKWTWTCRSGVKWHDGADFSADDVVFSLWALMNNYTGSQFVGYYQSVYGDNVKFTFENGTSTTLGTGTRVGNITALDATTIEIWLPELALGKPYGYFDPYLLSFANNIIPKHIFEKMPPADWTDSCFNTGEGTKNISGTIYTGPVGTGPYKWVDFDSVAQLVTLEKFTDYWNATALENEGLFGVTDYYIRFIADKTPALAALKNDEVQMLDPNYQMQVDIPTIDPAWGKVFVQEGAGRQEVGYNCRHPVFGTGVDTPRGIAEPSEAAEAARYVRIAFDYAIPRQLIIDNLLAGFGEPGATNMLPSQPYYNTSITARPYNLTAAKLYLEKAGYGVPSPPPMPALPSFLLGMSTAIRGIFTDADGNPLANRELTLWETTDNATYETTSEQVGSATTDLSGWYSIPVTPLSTGVYYYYLFDQLAAAGEEWQYVTMLNVSSLDDALDPFYDLASDNSQNIQSLNSTVNSLSDKIDSLQSSVNTMTYVAVAALVIAIVIGLVAIFMARKRP